MTMLRSLLAYFVAPVGDGPARPEPVAERDARAAAPPAVGLLCAPRCARSIGCAVGLRLAHRGRAGVALVAIWTGAGVPAGIGAAAPARRSARRMVAALDARGIPAHSAGRLVVVELPAGQQAAADAARRTFAVAAAVPTVLVLAGPRDRPLDDLLSGCDLVLVGDAPEALLADIAVEALRRRGIDARRCALPTPPAAAVAARGAGVLPTARRDIDAALEGEA